MAKRTPYFGYMNCCAIAEIGWLSNSRTPREALRELCKINWNTYSKCLNGFKKFVIFTGVVGIKGLDSLKNEDAAHELNLATHSSGGNLTYGPRFAKFIVANKFGPVRVIAEDYNKNHPTHLVRIWLWQPDNEAIGKWWAAEMKKYDLVKSK